jgi:hypothetical protein
MLRPLDIVVLLKLALKDGRPPYLQMANELHLYPSEVYNSIKRARASHFIQRPELEDRLNRSALLEFLLHGIRYAFPAEKGALTRGVPTGYAAAPLLESIAAGGDDPLPNRRSRWYRPSGPGIALSASPYTFESCSRSGAWFASPLWSWCVHFQSLRAVGLSSLASGR